MTDTTPPPQAGIEERARELLREHAGCAPYGLGLSVKTDAALRAIIAALRVPEREEKA